MDAASEIHQARREVRRCYPLKSKGENPGWFPEGASLPAKEGLAKPTSTMLLKMPLSNRLHRN